jgi:CheY-like chemotaxis protein
MSRVLFADDEPWNIKYYADSIKEKGHEIYHKQNVRDVLDFLTENPIDLLVVDIMMPYESVDSLLEQDIGDILNSLNQDVTHGIDLLNEVSQRYPKVKIIVLSILPKDDIRRLAKTHNKKLDFPGPYLCKSLDSPEKIIAALLEALESKG